MTVGRTGLNSYCGQTSREGDGGSSKPRLGGACPRGFFGAERLPARLVVAAGAAHLGGGPHLSLAPDAELANAQSTLAG